jgi:hypothetical protein
MIPPALYSGFSVERNNGKIILNFSYLEFQSSAVTGSMPRKTIIPKDMMVGGRYAEFF